MIDLFQQKLRLGRQVHRRIGRPIHHRGGPAQDAHLLAAHRKGGFRCQPRHRLQDAVQPAVAQMGAWQVGAGPGLQQVLAVEMAALVAVGGGCGLHKGQFARLPQGIKAGKPQMQAEEPIQIKAFGCCQGWPIGGKAALAQGAQHIQPIHRPAQDDDDQPVIAQGRPPIRPGQRDGRQERMGGGRTAQDPQSAKQASAIQHRFTSG